MRELCPKATVLIGLGLLLFSGGCSTPGTRTVGSGNGAHFIVINLSDCEWQIMLAPAGGGPVRTMHLLARETQETDLAGGNYQIEQTVLPGSAGIESTRKLTVRLDPGQTYRWRLVTLLSAPAGVAPANDNHE